MWVWYFILIVLLFMVIIQFISKEREKPFSGLKNILPGFNQEASEELTSEEERRSQSNLETFTNQSVPYFETTLYLEESSPNKLTAEWSVGENLKNELTNKYGQEFWHNSLPVLRIYHTNALPEPYYQDFNVDLERGKAEININAPGETLNSQLGVITETGSFIPLAHSNDVIIPIKS